MFDYKLIGERLRKARKNKKMTQEKLSKTLGVSIAFLSRIERGSSQLSLKRLGQICKELDISEGYILNGTFEGTNSYLESDFKELLDKATNEQKKLIYEITNVIIND